MTFSVEVALRLADGQIYTKNPDSTLIENMVRLRGSSMQPSKVMTGESILVVLGYRAPSIYL